MANVNILNLPIAVSIDGNEWSPCVQGLGNDAVTRRFQLSQTASAQFNLDSISTTQGAILYRGATAWAALEPATGFLKTNGPDANPEWSPEAGLGTVTSVAMSVPSFLSVAGSPVTTSGTLAVSLATQSANQLFAGPTNGAAATPTFRAIVNADIASAGAALTKVDDTNVTLTLGGAASAALVNAASLTLGWTGTLGLARGGTNANLSATGGTSQVLKQVTAGAAITVGQLAASDLSNGVTGSGAVVLAVSPALTGTATTENLTVGASNVLKVPNSNAPTIAANGDLGIDNSVADFSSGVLEYYSGEVMGAVAMPIAQFTAPTDGYIVSYDGTADEFVLRAEGAGTGATRELDNLQNVAINTTLLPGSNDGAALGSGSFAFSDLFLASGGVINWNNGDVLITHSSNSLAITGMAAGTFSSDAPTTALGGATTTGSASIELGTGRSGDGNSFIDFHSAVGTDFEFRLIRSGGTNGAATIQQTGNGGLVLNNASGSTTISATALLPNSNDQYALGSATLSFSDLFLASGAVINIANSNWVATHSSGILTVGTGDLRVTTAGTNTASVVTVGGTQTLTSKTLTSPTIGTSPTAAGATWTDLGTVTTADINGGTVDGTVIGGASAAAATFTNAVAATFAPGYTTTATAAGTTTLTVASTQFQFFTGSTTQTVVLPVTSTLTTGHTYTVVNNSTGVVTVQSSGANNVLVMGPGSTADFVCILTSGTAAASWSAQTFYATIPQNSQVAAYTTVLSDSGKHILHPTADNNARTFTIDSNANVPYPVGTTIMFINQINTVTIAIASDTLTLAGLGSTGNRSLAANGMATALKVTSTSWVISGVGLS